MKDINQADKTLHSLAQLIALTGMQWLPLLADDSQTNMSWNSYAHRLEGRPFVHSGRQIQLVIDTEGFLLQFIANGEQVWASFSPENRTLSDAVTWWTDQMQAWGISEIRGVNYHLDYDAFALQTIYERPSSIEAWCYWRTIANDALRTLTDWSGQKSEVRIWPHHFDTGVYYRQTDDGGPEKAAIWAGYAIADSICREPYFYLSGYNSVQPVDFTAAPTLSIGEWRNTAEWKGAMLPISAVNEPETIDAFFRESYRWLHQFINTKIAFPAI